jgi:SnoaL-like domain
MEDAAIRAALVRQFEEGRDLDATHELYHDDAVLEFPQSGERFVGKDAFLTWRKRYPAKVDYRIRRITGHDDLWAVELLASYDGSAPMFGVSILRFRDDRIARESIYVMAGFEAAAWRSEWVTPFDPLASVAPSEWREGEPFGIEPDQSGSVR